MRTCLRLTLLVTISLGSLLAVFPQTSNPPDPLIQVLQTKGILTQAEARAITANDRAAMHLLYDASASEEKAALP